MLRLSLTVLIALFIYKCNCFKSHKLADFGLSLFQLSSQPGKQVISPVAESLALGAVYEGSQDETRKQIGIAMFGTKSEGGFERQIPFLHIIAKNLSYDGEGQQSTAKMLLLTQKRFSYEQQFLTSLKTNYEAVEKKYNFNKPKVRKIAATETEEWVKTATGGFVKGTVEERMFHAETRSSPISAIFTSFKWKNPLTKESGEFGGKQVSFLKGSGEYLYKSTTKYEMLGMEMVDDAATLYIFLPKGESYGELEKEINGETIILKARLAGRTTVEVKIPEMKIFSKYKFNAALQKLGVQKIFTKEAELGGIAAEGLDLYASYQAVGFEVNEDGVSGGATGTASLQSLNGAVQPLEEQQTEVESEVSEEVEGAAEKFVANRPFFFALVRKKSVLYAGRYM